MSVRAAVAAAVTAALVFGALALPVNAQVTVRGVVRDRVLRGGAPLSGAEVFVLGTAFTSLTNDSGQFELTLPPGRHSIVASHPVLDTLGLAELEMDVEIGAAGVPELELSTPPLPEYQSERCGRILGEGEGMLLGIVLGSDGGPAAGVTLRATWGVRRLTYRSSEMGTDSVTATAGASGDYVLCGVPRGEAATVERQGIASVRGRVTLVATAGSVGAGPLLLETIAGPVMRRDLVTGEATATAAVIGRLLTTEGDPVVNARIVSRTDSSLFARTDSLGRFRMRVARRTDQLLMRAIGRMPLLVEVALIEPEQDLGDLPMPGAAQQLDAVTVRATVSAERKSFDERRRVGLGTFLDDEELKRMPVITPGMIQNRVPMSQVAQLAIGDRQLVLNRGLGFCRPRFFIDGQDLGLLSGSEQEFFFSQAVRIEVYRATASPPRYTDFDGCGVVVLWMR